MSVLGWASTLGAGAVAALFVSRLYPMVGGRRWSVAVHGASSPDTHHRAPTGPALGAILLLSAVVIGPTGAVALAVVIAGGWVGLRRRAEVRRRRDRDAAVPELIDLFVLAASAGLPVATALPVVAERAPLPLRALLADAARRMARGGSAAAALEQLRGSLGPRAAPLLDALDAAGRLGTPLTPALALVSTAAHHQRTQAAEEAARRLPVTLLFPLAACILPAAVLLALVPVLVASLGSLAG